MNNLIYIFLLLFLANCASVKYYIEEFDDDIKFDQGIMVTDSIYLYVDNTPYHWYSFKINAGNVIEIKDSRDFIMDNKFVQVTSVPFNIGEKYMVKGSLEAEKFVLFKHMRW